MCKANGLPVYGTKLALIRRLDQYLREDTEDVDDCHQQQGALVPTNESTAVLPENEDVHGTSYGYQADRRRGPTQTDNSEDSELDNESSETSTAPDETSSEIYDSEGAHSISNNGCHARKGGGLRSQTRRATGTTAAAASATFEDLRNKPRAQLQKLCNSISLPIYGFKEILASRIARSRQRICQR
eukprot:gb/GECG01000899.1/.p1 GENE.gb/GECG01000899.1/~~gb/GECG01000899.1/.p1  ORF type:complete len:186 (+),score=23.27 gb/GECG01000899.1/:1-558(+)